MARGADGRWRTIVDDIGIPVGRPQTVVVDLQGRLPAGTTELRIATNMRIYWDQILFADVAPDDVLRVERLDPDVADLRARGFSAELAAAPPPPTTYDYGRVTHASPWKAIVGAYTRLGDVRPLVTGVDDRFVVTAPGDEIALSFVAARLRPLPSGTKRTFLLFADGFSKEMDLHSASPDVVEPLPFHGMARYPYAPELHPDTPDRR